LTQQGSLLNLMQKQFKGAIFRMCVKNHHQ
jgi:hypothetical protein